MQGLKKHIYNIMPQMADDDYQNLVSDIKENGFDEKQPIYLYEGAILDGWHRYLVCRELGVEPKLIDFAGNDIDAYYYMLRTNKRRNLTSSQWAVIAIESKDLLEKLRAEAKERQATSGEGIYGGKPLVQTFAQVPESKTRDILAEKFNTNRQYIQDALKIEKSSPELIPKIKTGEISIASARREVKRKEVIANLESIEAKETKKANGVYDVIVIDPPWPIEKIERDVAPDQVLLDYPTMGIAEIKELKIPAADNCHILMWTTQKYLPVSFDILQGWGFKYICTFVWHKNGGFQPFNLPQYNCEFVLYARKGTPEFIDLKDFKTCFSAARTGHSKKPNEFYEMLKRVTAGRRLDMFGRREIDGFDSWGNEIDE